MKEQDSKRWSEKSKKKERKKKAPCLSPPSSQYSVVETERSSCRRMKTNIFSKCNGWRSTCLQEQMSRIQKVAVSTWLTAVGGFVGVDGGGDSVRASGGSRAGRGMRRIYCDINEVVRLLVMEWLRFCARKTNTLKCSCC